jgi:hypothetical protein
MYTQFPAMKGIVFGMWGMVGVEGTVRRIYALG